MRILGGFSKVKEELSKEYTALYETLINRFGHGDKPVLNGILG